MTPPQRPNEALSPARNVLKCNLFLGLARVFSWYGEIAWKRSDEQQAQHNQNSVDLLWDQARSNPNTQRAPAAPQKIMQQIVTNTPSVSSLLCHLLLFSSPRNGKVEAEMQKKICGQISASIQICSYFKVIIFDGLFTAVCSCVDSLENSSSGGIMHILAHGTLLLICFAVEVQGFLPRLFFCTFGGIQRCVQERKAPSCRAQRLGVVSLRAEALMEWAKKKEIQTGPLELATFDSGLRGMRSRKGIKVIFFTGLVSTI